MKIILIVLFLIFAYKASAGTIGANTFYASFTLTNGEYGFGATFPCEVWFNGASQLMRVDYKSPNGTTFMKIYYNYQTKDKYQVCGSNNCARSTWTAAMPIFQGNTNTYQSIACETPDYPGPRACVSSCNSWRSNPAQLQGINSLSYNDTGNSVLCLVRWTPAVGNTYGPEWHIRSYLTSGANPSPSDTSTYTSVISGVTCPAPTCFAELDVSIIVDESGSIFTANAWDDVQGFVKNLIGSLDIKPTGVRAGLAYFSGLDNCYQNWTGTQTTSCGSYNKNNDNCGLCGGRWNRYTTGVITDKAALIGYVNSNTGAKGFTCISCGLDIGIKTVNFAPKANVQKLVILFTDGAQNRVDANLGKMGKQAYDQNIKVIAIGTGAYQYSDLQLFATTIYTTQNFNQLSSLISSIITPLCQPLPNIDTCDFCSGLCSCTATCNCPTCNDFNMCTTERCDPRQPPDGTSGICVTIPVTCNDNNPCTQNNCLNATGCDYSTPTTKPSNLQDTYCRRYICTNPQGFTLTDIGSTLCVQGADKCIITYCNTTVGSTVVSGNSLTGSCQTINKSSTAFPSGSVITYTTSAGQTFTTNGCGKPSSALPCQNYTCNPADGSCIINNQQCACLSNADCNDGDGCTTDVCNTALNKCVYTSRDCWSDLSNGACVTGATGLTTNTTAGLQYYNGVTFSLDANGLPNPNSGVNRACDNLACYNGQRSSYTCRSTGASSYTCQRQAISCTSSSCQDSTCRSLGTWTTGQLNTDCSNRIARNCSDGSLCTTDVCSTTWTGTSCLANGNCVTNSGGARCINANNGTNCNDNSVCTDDTCVASTGCSFTNKTLPNNNCFIYTCNPTTGNSRVANTTFCNLNPANKCLIRYCNTTTQSCIEFNRANFTISQSISFVDQNGNTQTVTGCNSSHPCFTFSCNQTTGACYVNSSLCACTNNAGCDDGDGCTTDVCTNFVCSNTPIDCYANFSTNGCTLNQNYQIANVTGLANYDSRAVNVPFLTGNYNCDQLACYGGLRSSYTCQSLSPSNYQCTRQTATCPKGGCLDTICRTLNTWTNGVLDTDCGATFVPTCTGNLCFSSQCNTTYVFPSTDARCIVNNNGSSCDDNNLCTSNTCENSTGCVFPFTTAPNGCTNNTCASCLCTPEQGWRSTDLGVSQCTPITNLCQVQYCNTTTQTCTILDKNNIPLGSSLSYVDSAGITQSLSGCAKPASDTLTCRQYSCDTATGQCAQSIATCNCINDASCQDGDGCSIDKCNFQQNVCERTLIDCFSILSNGSCTRNQAYTADEFTGIDIYYGNASMSNNFTRVDANGLPTPSEGVARTCAQLGCYNGQPSQYSCFSTQEGQFQCQRVHLNCSRNGCQDNICRTLGNWTTDGQITTDCGTIFRPICADLNACTNDFCNTNWLPTDPVTQRCLNTPINATEFCNDGNYCTDDYCDNEDTSGNVCKHRLFSTDYVKQNLCRNATGLCTIVKCTVNKCVYTETVCLPPTLCLFFVCNDTTNGVCKEFPTGIYSIDRCGICGGNGLSCVPADVGDPKKTSIAVALGVGLGVGLCFAAALIAFLSKRSFDYYNALAVETQGTVSHNPTHVQGDNHIDTSQYNNN